jgi:hypothetical protein
MRQPSLSAASNRPSAIAQRQIQRAVGISATVQQRKAQQATLFGTRPVATLQPRAAMQLKGLVGRQGVIQAKGINFEAGVGNMWHVHRDHVKYGVENGSRINFDGRSKTYIKRQMELYHNTLPHNNNLHHTYIECRKWIDKYL